MDYFSVFGDKYLGGDGLVALLDRSSIGGKLAHGRRFNMFLCVVCVRLWFGWRAI